MPAKPIYMDHNASTPVDPRVVEAMLPCLTEHFGNPASNTHAYGWAAAKLVENARQSLAAAVGARPDEVVFTSGATESNNLAIKGGAWARADRGRRLVTVATEHKAVLDPCARLARDGWDVNVLPVDGHGRVDPGRFAAALVPGTVLASVMLANNEIGTLQPIAELAAICRERRVLLHCDATQALGKVPLDVGALGADLWSFSAHKVYGPKGVGMLVVRRASPRLRLVPLLDGGGHEDGQRSGTLNTPGIVGFARAAEIAVAELSAEVERLTGLRARLSEGILALLPGVIENGHPTERLPNTLNLSFEGVDGGALLVALSRVAVSSGSACTSAEPRPSHVLAAIGRSKALAAASLRFSLGRGTSEGEVDEVVEAVAREVERLRERSPLWKNRGEGER
ncbi:MAG: cysteine desulfurase family protein [Acidobacteriota bacterium]